MEKAIRSEVWKFLLGYADYDSTTVQREELRKRKYDEYFRMKLQWKTISAEQELRFTDFASRKALVEKDVMRTDRTHSFFQGENNANAKILFDILMTYCMYNFDLGYVQGMSDLLSPLLVVLESEPDTFWCFVGFMQRLQHNFAMDQAHIKLQLMQLRDLLMVLKPDFLAYLEKHDSDNMFFAFRWVLILFKREFNFDQISYLWEVLWTDEPCRNFHLLLCVAILETQEAMITENRFGFTEILKHVNELSNQIDPDEILKRAESMVHQLRAVEEDLPEHVRGILGFTVVQGDIIPAKICAGTPDGTPQGVPEGGVDACSVSPASGSSIELINGATSDEH